MNPLPKFKSSDTDQPTGRMVRVYCCAKCREFGEGVTLRKVIAPDGRKVYVCEGCLGVKKP